MELKFCNTDCHLSQAIPRLYTESVLSNINIETLLSRYDNMRENVDEVKPIWKTIDGFKPDEYGDLSIPVKFLRYQNLANATNLGLDLPTWFNYSKTISNVMILAMEPLRRPKTSYTDFVTLASPFALHYKTVRNKVPYSTSFKFIYQLVDDDFAVYLTDIYKLYSIVNGRKYTGERELNREIFKKELEIVKPEYIVVFGKTAQARLQDFNDLIDGLNIKVIYLTHPAAFRGNKHFFSEFKRLSIL
jgi:hypothetical protein